LEKGNSATLLKSPPARPIRQLEMLIGAMTGLGTFSTFWKMNYMTAVKLKPTNP
jgi:hypothetical protein